MAIHDLRDYYRRQGDAAARLMIAQPEGLNKQSAEDAVAYFRNRFFHFNELCTRLEQ